jgi:hypothetical protein
MRKILATLIIASLLSAASVAPIFADENYYGMSVFNPFWPIATALSIPASIIASVVSPGAKVPVILPTFPALPTPAPVAYSQPAQPAPVVYSAPRTYYVPGPYYAPRVYVGPRGYYAPRAYYPYGGYVVYGRGW